MSMIKRILPESWQLPRAAREERCRDAAGLPARDPGIDAAIDAAVSWLGRAQDCTASADEGVARDYSLVKGWASSYPETTGYIVPTLIEYGQLRGTDEPPARARRMTDWLVSIQLDDGAFQGGKIDATPVVPVTFNTGQILLGLAAAQATWGAYETPMRRAADWLVATQDDDGCWRRFPTPFAKPGEKVYETHVAWGLFEAERVQPGRGYAEAGLRQVEWALQYQRENGWIDRCCLTDPSRPLTHTLGYALRGIMEAFRISGDDHYLRAARRTADGLMSALDDEGHLAGRLDADWQAAASWACLTGSVQIAHCWLLLYRFTGDVRYRDAGLRANRYVRRTIRLDGNPDTRGGIKGSFPVDGEYGRFEYLNWAAKFFIDTHMLELEIRTGEQLAAGAVGARSEA